MEAPAPTLSLRERDRRWRAVRALMQTHEVDCLFVGGFRGRARYEGYITDDYLEGAVVFPLEGEPTALTWNGAFVSRSRASYARGIQPWVDDYRVGLNGPTIAAVLREKGHDRSRVGVVGLGRTSPGESEGFIPYQFWADVLRELPQTTFVDLSQAFAELVLVRSDEELALIRHAARISEAACQVMLDVTRPGVGEEVIYAAIAREVFRHGADLMYPVLSLQSGAQNVGWGPPRWTHRAERPRQVQVGDLVQTEIHTTYGGLESQVQMAVALDPVDAETTRCEAVARRSYEAGLRVLRPGIAFAELVQAMEAPLREAGCWAKTPLCHTLTLGGTGHTPLNLEQLAGTEEGRIELAARKGVSGGDLLLRPGMTLELEPNASLGTRRVNIGGVVVVTDRGREELNTLPTCVRHVA